MQFQRETTIRIRVCLLELNETHGSGLASHTPVCLQSTEGSRIASQSVHRLLDLGHVPDGSYTGPEVSCDSCCFFCDWYTTCSSSNLPSSEYAGQDCRGESPLVEWSCDTVHFSLIDPNRPQRTEFIWMHDAHLEPLRRDHIRTKLPVRPTIPTGPDSDHGARRMPRRDTAKQSEPNRRGAELPLR